MRKQDNYEKKPLGARIDADLYRRAKVIAINQDMSFGKLLEKALEYYLEHLEDVEIKARLDS